MALGSTNLEITSYVIVPNNESRNLFSYLFSCVEANENPFSIIEGFDSKALANSSGVLRLEVLDACGH